MDSFKISSMAFLCIFGGALSGFLIQRFLPPHHLSKESQDSLKLGAGLVATMAALILGLMVSSTKSTFDRVNALVSDTAAKYISLDQTLRCLGPQANPLRNLVLERVTTIRNDVWPEEKKIGVKKASSSYKEEKSILFMIRLLAALKTQDAGDDILKNNAISLAEELNKNRWEINVEALTQLPKPLVVIPIIWITFLTLVYAIIAPRNGTVITVLFFCSLSISGAIYMISEMSTPLDGAIRVQSQPFQTAIDLISE